MSEEDAHRAFRALLEALAQPGRWQRTPAAGAEQALELLRAAVWEEDDSVLVSDSPGAATAIRTAGVGTEEEPERGATVVVHVDGSEEIRVVITGPGIAGELETGLPLRRAALQARGDACAHFPVGIDLVLIDREGRVLGLPRTTVVTGLS